MENNLQLLSQGSSSMPDDDPIGEELSHLPSDSPATVPFLARLKPSTYPRNCKSSFIKKHSARNVSSKTRWWHNILNGWRAGLFVGLIASTIVLVVNIMLFSFGALAPNGYQTGVGTIAVGDSTTIERLGIAHHILVNTLSTVLLTASNYCMQILCAPSRVEIDMAHARGQWVDVGITSVHNLRYISRKRALSFLLLIMSSLPLHLFYNSAVFEVTRGHHYGVDFINGTNDDRIDDTTRKLENKDWLAQYNSRYVRDASDLFLHIDGVGLNFTLASNATMIASPPSLDRWSFQRIGSFEVAIVGDLPRIAGFIASDVESAKNLMSVQGKNLTWPKPLLGNPFENNSISHVLTYTKHDSEYWILGSDWSSIGVPPLRVASAWARPKGKSNQVQISLHFMAIVIACNVCKVFIMLQTLRASFIPRINTLGDAVSSFLERPDPMFAGMCLLDKDGIIETTRRQANNETDTVNPRWSNQLHRYSHAPMEQRWLSKGTVIVLIAISFSFLLLVLTMPIDKSQWGTSSTSDLWITHQTFDTAGILTNAFLANLPQAVLSYTYFAINRLCTSMCFSREWNEYGTSRKGLRVTSPAGRQRKTFFLQLPYRWAIPLTITSGLMHWLASQTIFLSRMELQDAYGKLIPAESKSTMGFSALSASVLCAVLLIFGVVIMALGFRKIAVHVPPALHCSMVIAAACHPPPDDAEPHLKKVKWGVVQNRFGGSVDHCTFTGEPVSQPEVGKEYA